MESDRDCSSNPAYLQKHGILEERVIEKTCDSVLVEFTIPQTCDFYCGHFPQIQLLPGVAQIDIFLNLAKKYFGTPLFALATKRTKFMAAIFPNTTVRLFIKFNAEKNSLSFKFFLAPPELNSDSKNSAAAEENSHSQNSASAEENFHSQNSAATSNSNSTSTSTEKIFSCGTFSLGTKERAL